MSKSKPDVLNEIENKYSRSFENREIIEKILSAAPLKKESYDELIFTGKYLNGLLRASSRQEFMNSDVLTKEISGGIEKIKFLLNQVLEGSYNIYEEIYFIHDGSSFKKFTSLISDLELLKLHSNDLKKKS